MNRKFTRFSIFLIVAIVMGTVVFFSACKKDSAIINNDNNAANSTPQISLSDNEAGTKNDSANSDSAVSSQEHAPSSDAGWSSTDGSAPARGIQHRNHPAFRQELP